MAAIADCILSKRRIAVEAVRIEDRANITERMSRDGGDLRLGALHEREPRLRPKKLRLGRLMSYGFARLRLEWPGGSGAHFHLSDGPGNEGPLGGD